jgi:hypothetical protein
LIAQEVIAQAAESERQEWDLLTELITRVQAIQSDLSLLVEQTTAPAHTDAGPTDQLTIETPPEPAGEPTEPARTWGVTRAPRRTWKIF